jgi:predicted permease
MMYLLHAVIPASFALITSVSFASAWCLGKMFQLSRAQFRVAIAGAMFMNTNTIPIALIQSLSMSLDKLKINSLDTPDKVCS